MIDLSQRGLGWIRGPAQSPLLIASSQAHVATSLVSDLPDSFRLPRPPWFLNQLEEESCFPHTGILKIYELTGEKCSPYVPWAFAREFDRPGQPLRNVGCSVGAFIHAIEEHGACLWKDWNRSTKGFAINERPGGIARALAQKVRLDVQPIYAIGDDAIQAMRLGLVQEKAGSVVVNVDGPVDHPDADRRIGPEDGSSSRGQHAMEVRAFEKFDGEWFFESPGTWGEGYGPVWLHESRIARSPFLGLGKGVVRL